LLLIVLVFTSILIPLVLGALTQNAILLHRNPMAAAYSLVLLQILGVAWVMLQCKAITGAPYQRCIASLPVGSQQTRRVNFRILIEADALLASLWIAGNVLIITGFHSPLAASNYALRAASAAVLVLAAQYTWLWQRRSALSLAHFFLLDAAFVAAMYFTRSLHHGGIWILTLIVIGTLSAAWFSQLGVFTLRSKALLFIRGDHRTSRASRRYEQPAANVNDNPRIIRALCRFYMHLISTGLPENFVLRAVLAALLCATALFASVMRLPDPVAPLFWFMGVALSANLMTGLRQAFKDIHANSRPYYAALPIETSQVELADGITLGVFATGMALPFAVAGAALAPQAASKFLLGIPLALVVSAGQFMIGTRAPKQSVILVFLLDIILVGALSYVV
ncbi:MAG: hypothetical protein ACRETQ_03395, partial [Gammaproteobacteria bacterium]